MAFGVDEVQRCTLLHPWRVSLHRHRDLVTGIAHHIQGQLTRLFGGEILPHPSGYLGCDAGRRPDQRIDITQCSLVTVGEQPGVLVTLDIVVKTLRTTRIQRGAVPQ